MMKAATMSQQKLDTARRKSSNELTELTEADTVSCSIDSRTKVRPGESERVLLLLLLLLSSSWLLFVGSRWAMAWPRH